MAKRLAAVTAGQAHEFHPAGKGPSSALDILAALGMSSATTWGAMLLLASYTQDKAAWAYSSKRAARYVWLSWLMTARQDATATPAQAQRLADLALQHHCNPELARKTPLFKRARLVRIGRDRYIQDFHPQYQRLAAEMMYQEWEATVNLMRKL